MIVVTTNDFINENPCGAARPCSSVAITRRLANTATIKQNNSNIQPKRANPIVSWLFAFRGFLNS